MIDARRSLEVELETKLNHAWSRTRPFDGPEICAEQVVVRVSVVYPVEDVEEFSTQLTSKALAKRNVLYE